MIPCLGGRFLRCPLDLTRYLYGPGDFYINGELDIVVKFAVDLYGLFLSSGCFGLC
jgi:hypothetical protein